MVLLDNETFLTELTKLFNKVHNTTNTGSVWMTMKRYDGHTKPQPRNTVPAANVELKCLMRATCGKKNISTVVSPKDVNKFHMAYATLMRGNIDNLKKRDKKAEAAKKRSAKSTAVA